MPLGSNLFYDFFVPDTCFQNKLTRRDFLKVTALGIAGLGAGKAPAQSPASSRLAITMWDFSWLTRRVPPEDEYQNWDMVLDELAERGYNCVRIDAFPHLIARDKNGRISEEFEILPQPKSFPWGAHQPVKVKPREALLEFIQKCRERKIKLGLSSWFNDDTTHRRKEIKSPQDYARIWSETLELLEKNHLLEQIVWVDLCNEFPLSVWAPGAYQEITRATRLPPLPGFYTKKQKQYLGEFFQSAILPLKKRWSKIKFCFSFCGSELFDLTEIDLASFDLIEAHIWLAQSISFNLLTGHYLTLLHLSPGYYLERALAPRTYQGFESYWKKWLEQRMKNWALLSKKKNLALFTSEGWGPINYRDSSSAQDSKEWNWVKEVCAFAVEKAIELGWKGICTSNFTAPQFPGIWQDKKWHQTLTRTILSA